MKILLVNKYLYYKGGAETYTLKIGKYLEEHNHEVQYFGMYSEKNVVRNKLNLYTHEMDFHTNRLEKILYPFEIIYSWDARRKIKKIIKQFQPDIIHMNNINFQLTPSIIDIASKMNVPIVQTVHDYQMICPNHLLFTQNKICERCIKGSKWNCAKYNCIHRSKIKSIIGSIEAIFYNKILKTYKKVSTYVCPSYFLEKKLLEKSNIYKGKTIAIHNYIELTETINTKPEEEYVLFFGRLSEEKGLTPFLEACRNLPDIKFKIAGTGPLAEQCKGIKNVEYVGFKTGKDLELLISQAQFSIYPSIWYENCPLSILESQSLGTPVITANYGGMKELIENGETGILIDQINPQILKEAILKLYNDKKLIQKMSQKCIEKRAEMISLKQYCNQLVEIYANLIKQNK